MEFGLYGSKTPKAVSAYNFYGLDRLRRASRGEFSDMVNMSGSEYPCAAPRGRRRTAVTMQDIRVVCAPDSAKVKELTLFTGIAGGVFYYNGAVKSGNIQLGSEYKWSIIRMGSLYIINGFNADADGSAMSVMYYYDSDTDKFDHVNTVMDDLILTSGTNSSGNYLATFRYGFDAVAEYKVYDENDTLIADNSLFFDKYATASGKTLPSSNIFEQVFEKGEELTIEGFPDRDSNFGQVWTYNGTDEEVIPQKSQDFHYNNTVDTDIVTDPGLIDKYTITSAVVSGFDVSSVTIDGVKAYIHYIYFDLYNSDGEKLDFDNMSLSAGTCYCSAVRLSSRTRHFDHITAHHNRIWGTVPTGNMIFASASDDTFSFSAADIAARYAARIVSDTPGAFTGICEYGTEVVAFKEDSITVIYGSNAANYSASVIEGVGCIDPDSIAVTPEGVIFLAYHGFYIYSGGVPRCISSKLNASYSSAVSGFDGSVYYAAAVRGDTRELLTYDTRTGLWHIQDDFNAVGFFRHCGSFYIADSGTVYEADANEGDTVSWSFTSVRLYDNSLDNKAVTELWLRADVEDGAEFIVETSTDGEIFVSHGKFSAPGHNVFRVPVRAVNGSCYFYRISGTGRVVFYEIELLRAEGGRRYKTIPGTVWG